MTWKYRMLEAFREWILGAAETWGIKEDVLPEGGISLRKTRGQPYWVGES